MFYTALSREKAGNKESILFVTVLQNGKKKVMHAKCGQSQVETEHYIPLRILIAFACLKHCGAEPPLRVGLICGA